MILTALTLFTVQALAQNTASVSGTIKTADGQLLEGVTVSVTGLKLVTSTNDRGEYRFNRVQAGTQIITTKYLSLESQNKEVTLTAGQHTRLDFVMMETSKQLEAVSISSGRVKTLADKKSDYVARMPLKNLENPQVYTVISKELLKQQISIDIVNAVQNTPGAVAYTFPAGGVGIAFRGFISGVNARNGMETSASRSSLDISNVERIEVLKGPSGTLFGSAVSSFGGVVNLVTKKPFDTTSVEVSYTAGSYNLNRLTADVNTPLDKDKTVLFRVNLASNREASFLNYGFNNTYTIAPSLIYKSSDKLTFHFDAEFFNAKNTRRTYNTYTAASGLRTPAELQLDYTTSMFHDDNNGKTSASKFFAQAEYIISGNWKSTTLFSFVGEDVDYSYQSYANWLSPTRAVRQVGMWGPISNNFINLQQNFNGKFSTGGIKHNFLGGINYRYYDGSRRAGGNVVTLDTINVTSNFAPIRRKAVDAIMPLYTTAIADQQTLSAYASDVINVTDRLSAMLSLRVDRFERKKVGNTAGYKQTALSPKLGLVYQVVKDQVSLFGNYMNGFQNLAPVTQPDGSVLVLDPVYAVQYEGGVKAELLNRKLSITASYYNIDIDNATRTEANFTVQDGKQRSKGIDFEVTGNPVAGLSIVAGYAYNDNRIVKSSNAAIEGNKATTSPENVANFWATYTLQNRLKGLGFGFGANYADKNFFTADNTFYMPSYTVYSGTVFYDQSKWRLGVKLNNISSKKYWDIGGNSQAPRNVMASLSFRF
ncbi:TonB-dependent receptor [Mucilaginibacter galii]|uniref:TonB-dependent receptor n=2 Tax=Mucilaginibacter galii TaxID=2005073 RepID=A0A917JCT0_9SPHI|nr:TonB-dependent receptor [Mucilaginibacter galii]